ncbi:MULTISPECIES: cobalt-precorrin-6A reductase [unclassified Methylobacterium]|uniref:cobalt-precorrin-6A reductase n=1 Tax=unclassified Methylobacterium TaxID=2615210 RepID=UPI0006F5A847|nr:MULTISPECIES: cobalt-precorrin-6A reductase [unclassified Methylobacterium]KQP61203.1 cobalt-precorrin-6X reductase [Methylobacterium sp. Leaf108]KQT78246.1 cobalt-precorrin-6X reductase [Methylobacterium sp. Leaf466]
MRILILGGTGEASALVAGLAGTVHAVTLSLAGRTTAPRVEPVRTRVGGFGGAEGLAAWLRAEATDLLVDATHPFAARIGVNAAVAAQSVGIKILAVRRPPWPRRPGDLWTEVASVADCVAALGPVPRRVFVTVGRLELPVFAAAPQHDYVVRTIEPVGDALPVPRLTTIAARGPFAQADEARFMREAAIEVLVTKNSGGEATYGKVAAARALAVPVVIVRQPEKPEVARVADAAQALAWIEAFSTR